MAQRMGTQAEERWHEGTLSRAGGRDSSTACGVLKRSPEFVKPCPLLSSDVFVSFSTFPMEQKTKTDVRLSLDKIRSPLTPRGRGKKRPPGHQEDGPVQERKRFLKPQPSPSLH